MVLQNWSFDQHLLQSFCDTYSQYHIPCSCSSQSSDYSLLHRSHLQCKQEIMIIVGTLGSNPSRYNSFLWWRFWIKPSPFYTFLLVSLIRYPNSNNHLISSALVNLCSFLPPAYVLRSSEYNVTFVFNPAFFLLFTQERCKDLLLIL